MVKIFKQGDFSGIEEIGCGGEGAVFKANTKTFGTVAVKVFTHKVNRREIANLKELSHHPNIIDLFGIYEGDDKFTQQLGYIMKYMARGSIDKVIHVDRLQVTLDLVYSWILQAARAIAFLHDRNVIHRDIKPANQGSTYLYQAPEMFKSLMNYSMETDVFSFAISMCEIVTRRVPYSDNPEMSNILTLMENVCKGTRPSVKDIYEADFVNFLIRTWDSEGNKRPTMKEIVKFFEMKVSNKLQDWNSNSPTGSKIQHSKGFSKGVSKVFSKGGKSIESTDSDLTVI